VDNALYGLAFASLPENKEYFHFVEYRWKSDTVYFSF
jgi:hypothetical protein